jgi:hypothetical protein
MPPKADPAGGDGEGPDPALEEEKELVERELVISHLFTRLGKYQSRGKYLADLNQELIDELETQKVNLQDINSYLTNELRAKELATGEMEGRVASLARELDELRDLGQTRLRGVAEEAREQQSGLRAQLGAFEVEMAELDAFSATRDTLDAELREKEALLELQRENHAARLDGISHKSSTEKDRLKKELAQRIKDTKANMKKMTDAQLEMTTKRTIIENEQMGSELVYQARQTEKLLDRNEQLASEHDGMGGELGEARGVEQELAKRNHVYQKTIRTLTFKLAQQQEAVRYDQAAMGRGEGELKVLTRRLLAVQHERDALAQECDAAAADRDEAAAEVREGSSARAECARFLEACAGDIDDRMRAVRTVHETSAEVEILVQPGRLEELSLVQRRRALDYLLDKINGGGGGGGGGGGPVRLLQQQPGQGAGPGGRMGGGLSMSEMYARPGASSPTLPPISRAGGGSFAGGIGGAPSGGGGGGDPSGGGCSIYLGGDGSSMGLFGAFPSASYGGGGGGGKNPGGGGRDDGFGGGGRRPTKVDAAVQTVPSGEQPAMWQEVAAVDAMHQTWSAAAAPPRSRKAAATKGGVGGGISLGGGDSFARSGMKQSYNFSGKRK